MKKRSSKAVKLSAALIGGFCVATPSVFAQQNLPAMGEASEAGPWETEVYYQNHTAHREGKGLAKFRNTLQVETKKEMDNGWRFRGILRGSYDGVYDLNPGTYGNKAGGSVTMGNAFGPFFGANVLPGIVGAPGPIPIPDFVPYGAGVINNGAVNAAAAAGVFDGTPGSIGPVGTAALGNTFVNDYGPRNANEGLKILGEDWNDSNKTGGVGLAVPVRPCDEDKRGCKDFGGYGDKTKNELAFSEFNDRWDFIREAYVTKTFELGGNKSMFVKLGKQQVVWGRTDLFRVLDVINPVDYSRNNIYDELEDIRIPMWIAQAEYRMGGSDSMQDRNLQIVWNFDKFRPNNLGQGGTPNSILEAGDFFRAMANCWDNGCTVGNFAFAGSMPPQAAVGLGGLATNFGPNVIGIRNVHLPSWSLKNTQLGLKFEGVTKGGLSFSLNALTYRSQLPSLRGARQAVNAFTGEQSPTGEWPYLIAFDVYYPRVNLVGGSMDFQVQSLGAAVRLEGALTRGEEFANTLQPKLYSKNKVFRSVIGVDRPTFVPFISNTRTVLFSGQLFYQHIFDHESERAALGRVGMPDWEHNVIGTLLVKAFLANDRISPEVIMARDFKARAGVVAPAVEWLVTNNLQLKFGANVKVGSDQQRHQWDDARTANPFHPYTSIGQPGPGAIVGLSNSEPLGRFRAGPIGTAMGQDDFYITLKYKF
jgi:hypothetical protein